MAQQDTVLLPPTTSEQTILLFPFEIFILVYFFQHHEFVSCEAFFKRIHDVVTMKNEESRHHVNLSPSRSA